MEEITPNKQRRSLSWHGDKIFFMTTRDVKLPEYGTEDSVGIDFFVPNDFIPITLQPGEDALIPSGLRVKLPKRTALIAFNKSGVATKKKFSKGAQVIDPDYQGEVHLHVFNVGKEPREINPGDKIVQFIHLPIIKSKLIRCQSEEELYPAKTERGTGGFGSTGNDKKLPNVDQSKIKRSVEGIHREKRKPEIRITMDAPDEGIEQEFRKISVPVGKKSIEQAKQDLLQSIAEHNENNTKVKEPPKGFSAWVKRIVS